MLRFSIVSRKHVLLTEMFCGKFNYPNERDILEYIIIAHRIRVKGFFLRLEQYCLKIVADLIN